jgi:hypothetical protein
MAIAQETIPHAGEYAKHGKEKNLRYFLWHKQNQHLKDQPPNLP